jgi:NADPH-dependent 2,4-dienoyl-CoA reductase/sulfur reductase-like enzyme
MATHYKYIIVGGGMAADAAVRGIRGFDASGTIAILTAEKNPPYKRPPLSKALWKGEAVDSIWKKTSEAGAEVLTSIVVTSVDTKTKSVATAEGTKFSYEKLLLATGGMVRKFPWDVEGIIYFRTFEDYKNLRSMTEKGKTFAVIGGGFIGSEVAAALAMNNESVKLFFPEEGIGARIYPSSLSIFLNSYFQSKGIEVHAKTGISGIEKKGSSYVVRTAQGRDFVVDVVVAGLGIVPNADLARSAGLTVDNGIHVSEYLRTSDPDVFAAGDVANFYNAALEKRIRVEHEDNANVMGEVAGKNMAGAQRAYHHLPFFYSDLFDLGYEAVGELHSSYETIEDWKEEFREGVVYYLKNERVSGVLLWNTWGQVDNARALIAEKRPMKKSNLKGYLPR